MAAASGTATRTGSEPSPPPRRPSAERAGAAQGGDLVAAEAPVGQGAVGVPPGGGGRAWQAGRGAAEAGGGGGPGAVGGGGEDAALAVVRVLRCLGGGEDRGEAGVAPVGQRGPLVAAAPADRRGDPLAQLGPALAVELGGQVLLAVEAEQRQQLPVELGFQRADGDVAAVGGLVHAVEGGAAVEQVDAALPAPQPEPGELVDHGGEQRAAVEDGRVDHLAAAGAAGLQQGAGDAEGEQHAAAAEVAEQVERRQRRLATAAERVQRAGEREVVDVVAGAVAQWALLPPAGHAPVHQP